MEETHHSLKALTPIKVLYQNGQPQFIGQHQYDIDEQAKIFLGLKDMGYTNKVISTKCPPPKGRHVHNTSWDDIPSHPQCTYHTLVRIKPISIKVNDPDCKLIALSSQPLRNNSSQKGTFSASLTAQVEDSVQSTWSESTTTGISAEVSIGVQIKMVNLGGSITTSTETTTGRSQTIKKSLTITSSNTVSTELQPGESVNAILRAYLGTAEAEITYEATLAGTFCYSQLLPHPVFQSVPSLGTFYHHQHQCNDFPFEKKTFTQKLVIASYSNSETILEDA